MFLFFLLVEWMKFLELVNVSNGFVVVLVGIDFFGKKIELFFLGIVRC